MKRALASIAGIVGIAALGRLLSRRKAAARHDVPSAPMDEAPGEAVAGPAVDPAEELRRTLAATRDPEAPDPTPAADETLEERRARVHAKARQAMDSMKDEGPVA